MILKKTIIDKKKITIKKKPAMHLLFDGSMGWVGKQKFKVNHFCTLIHK